MISSVLIKYVAACIMIVTALVAVVYAQARTLEASDSSSQSQSQSQSLASSSPDSSHLILANVSRETTIVPLNVPEATTVAEDDAREAEASRLEAEAAEVEAIRLEAIRLEAEAKRLETIRLETAVTVSKDSSTQAILQPIDSSANYSSGTERWRSLVASIFPEFAVNTVLKIMNCESGGNPNATGSVGERGLMQIHPLHHDSTYDPVGNLQAAFRISGGGTNWNAWSCKG